MNPWKQDYLDGIEVVMPHNGRTVRIRSVSVTALAVEGKLSNDLLEFAYNGLGVQGTDDEKKRKNGKSPSLSDIAARSEEYASVIVHEALRSPEIVPDDTPDGKVKDDQIKYRWLTDDDREFIVKRVQEPLTEWRRFRPKSGEDVEPVHAGKDNPSSAK